MDPPIFFLKLDLTSEIDWRAKKEEEIEVADDRIFVFFLYI